MHRVGGRPPVGLGLGLGQGLELGLGLGLGQLVRAEVLLEGELHGLDVLGVPGGLEDLVKVRVIGFGFGFGFGFQVGSKTWMLGLGLGS
eukprot:scaffold49680_cov45-Phaeocystis_antarctica.AAC.2